MKELKNPTFISIHHVPSQEWAQQFDNQRQWNIITCSSPLVEDLLPILRLITGTEVGDVLLDASRCTLRRLALMSIAADQGQTFNNGCRSPNLCPTLKMRHKVQARSAPIFLIFKIPDRRKDHSHDAHIALPR